MLTRQVRAAAALIAICAGLAEAAQAATPFTAGEGRNGAVAVGSGGTGHIVWMTDEANARVGYCRVRAGGSACERTERFAFGSATGALRAGRPAVFAPAANKVVIAASCSLCPGGGASPTYVWTSTDNGTRFGAPRIVTAFSGGTPISGGTWLDDLGIFVGFGPRVGATSSRTASTPGIEYAPGFIFDPDVERLPGTNRLIAAANDLDTVRFAVFTGAGTVAAINTPANWLTGRALPSAERGSEATDLTAGPSGVFLTYEARVGDRTRVGLRRFEPAANSFGAPAYVEGDDPIDRQTLGLPASFEDPAGRLHVLWRVLFDGNRLRYRVSGAGTSAFTPAANLALREDFVAPRLAAGADGQGFAVWSGERGSIRVVPLDPQPEPPVVRPSPSPTPAPTAAPPRDADRDAVPDASDNCPTTANRDQADADRDRIGDACEQLPPGNLPPVAGRRAVVRLVSGDVDVQLPGGRTVPLAGAASVPIGTTLDARKGVLALQTAANGFRPSSRRARRQRATVRAGIFRIRQRRARARRSAKIATDLLLQHPPNARIACTGRPRKGVVRRLTVAAKGRFRVFGGASTATARTATFTTADRCDGTLTSVRRGRVSLRIKGRRSPLTVRAGHRHLVKARLFRARQVRRP